MTWPPDITARLARDFAGEPLADALGMLEALSEARACVVRCVLFLAHGDIAKLHHVVILADKSKSCQTVRPIKHLAASYEVSEGKGV
jgi:hypothetical protein